MRLFLTTLSIGLTLLAAAAELHATVVYRYEWEASGSSSPATLGTAFSGYIDFLASSGSIINNASLSPIFDLQFTTYSQPAQGSGQTALPAVPAYMFNLANVNFSPNGNNSSPDIAWNGQKITSFEYGINPFGLSSASTPITASISDSEVQDFFPAAYPFNENLQYGSWVYEGTVNEMSTNSASVPDAESTLSLLMLSFSALAAAHFSKRRASFPKVQMTA